MRFLFAFLIVALACVASARPLAEDDYQFLFTKFVEQHGKNYEADEFFVRYNIFKNNLQTIHSHNAMGNNSYTLGMNKFGDMTSAEFKAQYLGYKHREQPYLRAKNTPHQKIHNVAAYPTSVDWRNANTNPKNVVAVTPVKNQQQCGSCWAFSTTGSVEGAWAAAGHPLVSLSEQQLIDCSGSFGNQGCNGGLMDQAFEYIISNKGICSEDSYPYTAQDGNCQTCTSVATITSYSDVPSGQETSMMDFIQKGPISIAIEADQYVFQFYSGGVLDDSSCGTQLDHGVLVVGYGVDSLKPYWSVKNSWGSDWGESGYIRLVRNKNECGLALSASQPYSS